MTGAIAATAAAILLTNVLVLAVAAIRWLRSCRELQRLTAQAHVDELPALVPDGGAV